jgi:hypothetical protein
MKISTMRGRGKAGRATIAAGYQPARASALSQRADRADAQDVQEISFPDETLNIFCMQASDDERCSGFNCLKMKVVLMMWMDVGERKRKQVQGAANTDNLIHLS